MESLPIIIKYILTGIVGMIPIIELRGAIPIGVFTFHLNYIEAFICSFIGNIIPVYFIVKFIRPLFDFFGRWKPFKLVIDWASERATKKITKLYCSWIVFICCHSSTWNRSLGWLFDC